MSFDSNGDAPGLPCYNRILAFMVCVGGYALLAQVLCLREFLVVFFGNELTIGAVFSVWLVLIGAGSFLAKFLVARLSAERLRVLLVVLLTLAAFLLPFQVGAIRIVRTLLHVAYGEYVPFLSMLASLGAILAPGCLIIGVVFPCACRLATRQLPYATSRVYTVESLGSMAAGAAFSFWLVWVMSPLAVAALAGAIVLLGALCLAITRPCRWMLGLAAFAFAFSACCPSCLASLERASVEARWRSFGALPACGSLSPSVSRLLAFCDSRYQNLALIVTEGQKTLYGNGQVLTVFPDVVTGEHKIHFIMAQKPDARRVLLIGGNPINDIPELLKYPLERLVYVELDEQVGRLLEPVATDAYLQALRDLRLVQVHMDAPRYVKQYGRVGTTAGVRSVVGEAMHRAFRSIFSDDFGASADFPRWRGYISGAARGASPSAPNLPENIEFRQLADAEMRVADAIAPAALARYSCQNFCVSNNFLLQHASVPCGATAGVRSVVGEDMHRAFRSIFSDDFGASAAHRAALQQCMTKATERIRRVDASAPPFDAILVDASEPATIALNRFYTQDFYRDIRSILSPDGFLYTAVAASDDLQGETAFLSASINAALRNVFDCVLVTSGAKNQFFAGATNSSITLARAELFRRSAGADIKASYFRPEYFLNADEISPEKLGFVGRRLASIPVTANTILKPISTFYQIALWSRFSGSGLESLLARLTRLRLGWVAGALLGLGAICFGIGAALGRRRSSLGSGGSASVFSRSMLALVMAATGLCGMALELILIFMFQALLGYVYSKVGLIVAMFMLGLTLGAFGAPRLIRESVRLQWRAMVGMEIILIVKLACIPWLMSTLSYGLMTWMPWGWVEALIYMAIAGSGALVGLQFALINELMSHCGCKDHDRAVNPQSAGSADAVPLFDAASKAAAGTAAVTNAADLAGAAMGGLVVGVVLLPLFGIAAACFLLASLKMFSLLCLLAARQVMGVGGERHCINLTSK